MLTATVISILFFCVAYASVSNECIYPPKIGNQPDYYWRNYYGEIPKDAVPGGYTKDGNVTYISQVPSPVYPGLFPGIIYRGQKKTVVCAIERVVFENNVKILCANPSENLFWISTTAKDVHLLTDFHWVIGGATNFNNFYIGRARLEGEVQVGRVFNTSSVYKGLWLCQKTGAQLNIQTFELLVTDK